MACWISEIAPSAKSLYLLALIGLASLFADRAGAEDLADLRRRQEQVQNVVKKVLPATVCVTGGVGMGSGVVVSEDGLVLTAGHVSGKPDREVTLIFPDGKMVKGKTLGANRSVDAGMVQITDEGRYPYVELGDDTRLKNGDWVLALGHPGGYEVGRTPPLRLGRVVGQRPTAILSDCTLIGGDSGGPLFDLNGRLVGIHSSIGESLAENRHIPVSRFREAWDRMKEGEAWGSLADLSALPKPELVKGGFLGVKLQPADEGVAVLEVVPGAAAEKAGLKKGDLILRVDGEAVESVTDMVLKVAGKKPGAEVGLVIKRDGKVARVNATLGRRLDFEKE